MKFFSAVRNIIMCFLIYTPIAQADDMCRIYGPSTEYLKFITCISKERNMLLVWPVFRNGPVNIFFSPLSPQILRYCAPGERIPVVRRNINNKSMFLMGTCTTGTFGTYKYTVMEYPVLDEDKQHIRKMLLKNKPLIFESQDGLYKATFILRPYKHLFKDALNNKY